MIAILEAHAVRSTNIADLRNHLTRYLKEVRAGEEIVVRDRQQPFAKIVPLAHDDEAEDSALVASGLMRRAEHALPASFWRRRRPAIGRDVAANAISRDRDND
jgi:prevent-host-death family protein